MLRSTFSVFYSAAFSFYNRFQCVDSHRTDVGLYNYVRFNKAPRTTNVFKYIFWTRHLGPQQCLDINTIFYTRCKITYLLRFFFKTRATQNCQPTGCERATFVPVLLYRRRILPIYTRIWLGPLKFRKRKFRTYGKCFNNKKKKFRKSKCSLLVHLAKQKNFNS